MQKILIRLVVKYGKVMRLVIKNHKLLTNSSALVAQQRAERRSVITRKYIYQWDLHGPDIQAVLFHCVSSGSNDFQMQL